MSQCQKAGHCSGSLTGKKGAALLLTKASAKAARPCPPPPTSQLCLKPSSSASVLSGRTTREKILSWCPCCLFQHCGNISHCLLATTVYVEKSAVYLIWVLLYMFCLCFSCGCLFVVWASLMLSKCSVTATHP